MSELASDQVFDFVDEDDAASDFFLVYTGVLVRLILIVIHQLVKVTHVGLQGRPRGLHEVLLAGDGLAGPCIRNLIDLPSESLDALLCLPVVSIELISAHC